LISGCSQSDQNAEVDKNKSSSPELEISSWQPFYIIDEDGFKNRINRSPTNSVKEHFENMASQYEFEIIELEDLVKNLKLNNSELNTQQNQSLRTGLIPIEELISSTKNLIEDLTFLISVHKGYDCSNYGKNKKKCDKALITLMDYNQNIFCALAKASADFDKIESFELAKSNWLSSNPNLRTACFIFPDSHLVYGYPRTVTTSDMPARISNWVDDGNTFVIKISDGLWATQTDGLSALEAFIYESWNGYCGPYRKYEKLLLDFGLDDGFKAGSCG
jgi:hypothetical protein